MTLQISRHAAASGLLLGLVASTAASAQACTPKHTFTTVEPGFLTVATYTYPPYAFQKDDGSIGGIDGEIATKFAEMECLKMKNVPGDPAADIQSVAAGRADLTMGDWFRTETRAKVLGLSAPLYTDVLGIYAKTKITKLADIVGKQVGVGAGNLWVEDLKRMLGSNLRIYPNVVSLDQDLESGRIDVAIDGYSTGVYSQKSGGFKGFVISIGEPDPHVKASNEAGQGAFPYVKSNKALGAALDDDIEEMHKDGTINKIVQSFGLDPSVTNTGPARLLP